MNSVIAPKKSVLGAALAAVVLMTAGCNEEKKAEKAEVAKAEAPAEIKLEEMVDKVTYIVGYNMTKQAQSNGLDFQTEIMTMAINDVLAGKEPRIAKEDQQKIMMTFQEEQQAKRDAEREKVAEENLAKAKAFMEEHGKKEGVVTTESGLQYQVISKGDGAGEFPAETDKVKVHYHGTLTDGTVFDSSVDRGQPVTFPVKGVINGWVEALQLMKAGDKFKLAIPPELAYGKNGTSGKIGPNAALIFEVELLEINPSMDDVPGHGGHDHGKHEEEASE